VDIRSRLLAPALNEDGALDVGGLFRRLVLFDHCVIESVQLTEIPKLLEVVGYDATAALLDSGAVSLDINPGATGEVSPAPDLFTYTITSFWAADPAAIRKRRLEALDKSLASLGPHKRQRILNATERRLLQPTTQVFGAETLEAVARDLSGKGLPCVGRTITDEIGRLAGVRVRPADLALRIVQTNPNQYRVDSKILQMGVEPASARKIVWTGLSVVARVNEKVERMKAKNALCALNDEDEEVLQEKMSIVWEANSPNKETKRLARVLSIEGVPELAPEGAPDLGKLLRALLDLRQAPECQEFRAWLRSTDEQSDEQVREQVHSLRARFGNLYQSKNGALVRLLAVTGIGTVLGIGHPALVGAAVSGGTSALDLFLQDMLLRKSGPVAFLDRLIPLLKRQ
jgi:hypothetical protein